MKYVQMLVIFICSYFTFGSLWKKIKIAKVSMQFFFVACHSDLIKMEESNKMTDDGYSCTACDHSTAPRAHRYKAQMHESERHEIIIIDILASIHFIGIAFIDLHQLRISWIAIKSTTSVYNQKLNIQLGARIGNPFLYPFKMNVWERKTNNQQIIITYVY